MTITLVALGTAAAAAGAVERYDNPTYGLSFVLPADAEVCRSRAPLPNHGLLFRPAGVSSPPCDGDIEDSVRYTSANAHFDVNASTSVANFVATSCPQMAYDSGGKVTGITPPVLPADLPSAACRIDGADSLILEILFTQRRATKSVPTIDYTFVLKTTHQKLAADHAAFIRWLKKVKIGRPS